MNQNISKSILYEWVATRYTGTQAEFVTAQAGAGIGYYVLERPEKGKAWITVAFRRPLGPLTAHLKRIVDERLIEKLEKWAAPLEFKMESRRKEIESLEQRKQISS